MSAPKNQCLLPRGHADFRTKAYWDDFFKKRGERAFEWYGDYRKLSKLCEKSIDSKDKVLVVGCGNSDYSSDLYDAGYKYITNIDFSDMVIQSMAIRNALREEMRWLVMDMTAMSFEGSSFDVVFDKGGLDALMAHDSAEVKSKANDMFADIARITRPGGRYLCVTLAEPFIIFHLLQYFLAAGWEVSIDVVVECGGRHAPFVPFFVSSTKPLRVDLDRKENEVYPIKLYFDSFGERRRRPQVASPNDAMDQIRRVQSYQHRQYDLGSISVGRFEQLDLWAGPSAGVAENVSDTIPKYTLTILDRTVVAPRSCAVFFVPFGREAAYQFTSQECLTDIASQAETRRLLVVRCNRPHVFPDMKSMQDELSPVCRSLAPVAAAGAPEEPIPFMGVESESEWAAIANGVGPLTGDYVVEETDATETGLAAGTVYRRLIFLRNQQFVQTEVRLAPTSASKLKKKKKKKPEGAETGDVAETIVSAVETMDADGKKVLQFDYQYLDAHHCSILVCLSLLHPVPSSKGLLIGLGGGALPMALRRHLPTSHLTVCELDPSLLDVARRYFGYTVDSKIEDIVCDGMEYMRTAPGGKAFDYIVLDADSADSSRGLSAPPAEFTAADAVSVMRSLLSPQGLLVINTVARDKIELSLFLTSVKDVFVASGGDVYILKPSEDTVNLTILAVATSAIINQSATSVFGSTVVTGATKKGKKVSSAPSTPLDALKIVVQSNVQTMLRETNGRCSVSLDSDPLELRAMAELLKQA